LNVEYFKTMYDYGYWARDRLFTAAQGMSEAEYASPNGFTYNGLRSILTHTLAAEAIWAQRFLGEPVTSLVEESEVPTLPALKERWAFEERRLRGFLDGLQDSDLERVIVVKRRSGDEPTLLWQLLAHVVNHGTQHRSEAAEALTLIGRSPGSLDLTTMLWDRAKR
jgi:uncharacterized damage-inducible protein DinB